MLLGDIIARLADETTAAEAVLRHGDLVLLAKLRANADGIGVTLGAYAAWAFRTYADAASPDEWTMLLSALSRSEDPGGTCLRRAFTYILSATAGPNYELILPG